MKQVVYIYSDESGVFDKFHNDYFVYAGIACVGQDTMSALSRKYLQAEKTLRKIKKNKGKPELKASVITKEEKRKLYRVCSECYKFAVVIKLKELENDIFETSRTKQRYWEYAYKYGIKQLLQRMTNDNIISMENEVELKLYVDEYSHSSNEKYSLGDIILNEFKYGTYVGYDSELLGN